MLAVVSPVVVAAASALVVAMAEVVVVAEVVAVELRPTQWVDRSQACPDRDSSCRTTAVVTYRSEERRVGKECSLPCRSRWSPYH